MFAAVPEALVRRPPTYAGANPKHEENLPMRAVLAMLIVAAALFVGACNSSSSSPSTSIAPVPTTESSPVTPVDSSSPEASPS